MKKFTGSFAVSLALSVLACGPKKSATTSGDQLASTVEDDAGPSAATFAELAGTDAAAPPPVAASDAGAPAPASAPDKAVPAAAPKGDEDGARNFLAQFVAPGADHVALTKTLHPTTADYKAMFDTATAAKVEASQAKDWSSNKAVIKPKATQTEVKLWSATGADLAAGKTGEFPDGYKKVGKHLAPSVLFFKFKFVEPGKDVGTAYDGLAFVNNHWVIAPKPWRALEGKPSVDDGADPAAAPKHKKPKGKKKK